MKKDLAVCVVADFKYLYRYFYGFKKNLQLNGNYFGDILIITSLLSPTFLLPSTYGSEVKVLRKKKIKLKSKIPVYLYGDSLFRIKLK